MINTGQTIKTSNCSLNLKLIAINVNSIVSNQKRSSLMNIIKEQNPDVVFLSETKLKPKHIISFKDYNIVRNDRRDKNGGGTALVLRKGIKFNRINIQEHQEKPFLEHTIIKVKIKTNTYLYIIAVYAPCGNQKEFIKEWTNIFRKLQLEQDSNLYIIAGDLNAKHTCWMNSLNNPRGTQLNKWMEMNEHRFRTRLYCTQFPSYPLGRSYLDLFIADTRLEFCNTVDYFKLQNIPYDSDHNAALAEVELPRDTNIPYNTEDNKHAYNYRKVDWGKFTETLEKAHQADIPCDRNLSIAEITKELEKMDATI